MNKQEAFNTAYNGIKAQGFKQSLLNNGSNMCAYRSPDGLKCAVGHMISDEQYNSDFETKIASFVLEKLGISLTEKEDNFVTALQCAHDGNYYGGFFEQLSERTRNLMTPEKMKERLEIVANRYNLEIPKD
jgi:hypothetical protein